MAKVGDKIHVTTWTYGPVQVQLLKHVKGQEWKAKVLTGAGKGKTLSVAASPPRGVAKKKKKKVAKRAKKKVAKKRKVTKKKRKKAVAKPARKKTKRKAKKKKVPRKKRRKKARRTGWVSEHATVQTADGPKLIEAQIFYPEENWAVYEALSGKGHNLLHIHTGRPVVTRRNKAWLKRLALRLEKLHNWRDPRIQNVAGLTVNDHWPKWWRDLYNKVRREIEKK